MAKSDNLGLGEDEFRRMNAKDQMLVLFRNTTDTKNSVVETQVIIATLVKKVSKHDLIIGAVLVVGAAAVGLLIEHMTGIPV